MAELEILGMPQSNYVWTTRIVAAEKGVPYKLVSARPHTPELTAIHPFGQMPAIRYGDFTLFETKAICTYIDQAFPGPSLVPPNPRETALVEQWISAINTSVDPCCVRQYLLAYYFPGTPDGSPDRTKIEAALPRMKTQLQVLGKAVAKTGHLVGEGFTMADAFLAPILYYLDKLPESSRVMKSDTALGDFLARQIERGSVKQTIPPAPPKKA